MKTDQLQLAVTIFSGLGGALVTALGAIYVATRTNRGNAEVAFRGDILKAWERASSELKVTLDRIDELERELAAKDKTIDELRKKLASR